MVRMEVTKKKGNYRFNLFNSNTPKPPREQAYRWYIVDRDVKKLAQVFIDLHFEGFPIEKAVKMMRERLDKKDWLGF